MSIGENIAKYRRKHNLTQEQLANLSDLTSNYLSKIERGVADNFSAINLVRIAQALGVSVDDLIDHETQLPDKRVYQAKLNALLDEMNDQQSEHLSRLLVDIIQSFDNQYND